jgi:hypothetical protein
MGWGKCSAIDMGARELWAYDRNLDCACALTSAGITSRGISRRSSDAASLARHGSSIKLREGEHGEDQDCPVG